MLEIKFRIAVYEAVTLSLHHSDRHIELSYTIKKDSNYMLLHSLLIEKDGCVHQNILFKFPCDFVCLSHSDLFNF
jgi:hypothetical protein